MTNEQLAALEENRYEEFLPAYTDSKGRVMGYIVGLNFDGESTHYAWVQKGIQTQNGFEDFGPRQRSKQFRSKIEARSWAFRTAKERAAR